MQWDTVSTAAKHLRCDLLYYFSLIFFTGTNMYSIFNINPIGPLSRMEPPKSKVKQKGEEFLCDDILLIYIYI